MIVSASLTDYAPLIRLVVEYRCSEMFYMQYLHVNIYEQRYSTNITIIILLIIIL